MEVGRAAQLGLDQGDRAGPVCQDVAGVAQIVQGRDARLAVLPREGATLGAARPVLDERILALRPHDETAVYAAAAFNPVIRRHGQGRGERSCMALGLMLGLPVLTAGAGVEEGRSRRAHPRVGAVSVE